LKVEVLEKSIQRRQLMGVPDRCDPSPNRLAVPERISLERA